MVNRDSSSKRASCNHHPPVSPHPPINSPQSGESQQRVAIIVLAIAVESAVSRARERERGAAWREKDFTRYSAASLDLEATGQRKG